MLARRTSFSGMEKSQRFDDNPSFASSRSP
jgi:hypothetical protein